MDGGSAIGMLKFALPHAPSLSYLALQHTLGATPTSSKWDLRTELTVHLLRRGSSGRKTAHTPPISKEQAMSIEDQPIKGKMWIAKASFPKPQGNDVRDLVVKAVEDMKEPGADVQYTKPESADLEVEWTGWREGAGKDEPLPPNLTEEEKYTRLMNEPTRTSKTTILYTHGGAYYMCGFATHRAMVSRLAKECKGRVLAVEYRLAPQTAFPGQLLDAFTAYLSLLYPPPGSLHEAVPAEHIVLAGDSAGGNLSFALHQFLLQLHRSSPSGGVPTVKFHGRDVLVPLPAGASANSGWLDISRSLPSIEANAAFDYVPPPQRDDAVSMYPHEEIWPTTPPRGDIFCDLSLLDHPLVSPVLAPDWSASPPLWMCVGNERMFDDVVSVASRAAGQGTKVQFELYEAMPHCFQLLMPWRRNSERCLRNWGEFARRCVEEPQSLKTVGTEIKARGGPDVEVDVLTVGKLSLEEVRRYVKEGKERRLKGWEKKGGKIPKAAI